MMDDPEMPRTDEEREDFVERLEEERQAHEKRKGLEEFYDRVYVSAWAGIVAPSDQMFGSCDDYMKKRDAHIAKRMKEEM